MKQVKTILKTATMAMLFSASALSVAFAGGFTVSSSSFSDNQLLNSKYAAKGGPRKCDGENISPALEWSDFPEKTKSFAIVVTDATGGHGLGINHWVGYGISASTTSLAEGAINEASDNYVGGKNRIGTGTYFGPCPGVGDTPHHYEFLVIALDLEVDALEAGLDKAGLFKAIEGHNLDASSIIGRYGR